MKLIPNNWAKVRAFYERHAPTILAGDRYEWAIPAYSWEESGGFHMTPIEAWLWADIRAANAIFYPQYPVAGFFVDFASPVAKVAIECDGYEYHLDKGKDRDRDEALERLGWTVYRISGHDCRTEADEETGEPGAAARFIRDIVERHQISRNHRPKVDEGWFHIGKQPEERQ
jgi:hypothetical protein